MYLQEKTESREMKNGEIDWPEGNLDDDTIGADMHWQGGASGRDQDAYSTIADRTAWHTYSIDWTPTAVIFYIDGVIVGQSTNVGHIPNTPMRWNLQVETKLEQSRLLKEVQDAG